MTKEHGMNLGLRKDNRVKQELLIVSINKEVGRIYISIISIPGWPFIQPLRYTFDVYLYVLFGWLPVNLTYSIINKIVIICVKIKSRNIKTTLATFGVKCFISFYQEWKFIIKEG